MTTSMQPLREQLLADLQAGDGSKLRAIVKTLVDKAAGGDMQAMALLLARVDPTVIEAAMPPRGKR